MVVGDRERDLGPARVAEPHEVRERDHAALEPAGERAALLPVGIEERPHELRLERREAVEAQVAAAIRERREEVEQCLLVLRARRAQAQRGAVPEDDVRGDGIDRAHARGVPAPGQALRPGFPVASAR